MYRPPVGDNAGRPGLARPVSATVSSMQQQSSQRPSSEVLSAHYKSPEARAIDAWFEDLSYYEQTLEQMARAKLDDNFCEELKHIEQWFNVLSDPERTTALYSLLQGANAVQINFFITVLQQMAQKDPATGAIPPPDQVGNRPPSIDAARFVQAQNRVNSMPARASSPATPPSVMAAQGDSADGSDKYLSVQPLTNGPRGVRRLYDRHSAPNAEEQYASMLGELQVPTTSNSNGHRGRSPNRHIGGDNWRSPSRNEDQLGEDYAYKRNSSYNRAPSRNSNAHMSPLLRPTTPVDDAIASADWSLTPTIKEPIARPSSGLGNGTFSPILGGDGAGGLPNPMAGLTLQPPRSPYAGSSSSRPVSPIILSPPTPTGEHPPSLGHPSPGWGYVDVPRSRTPNSQYARSDYSDAHSASDPHKEKGRIPESVDLEALNDIPSWLRSLRLHKYTDTFQGMYWKDMIVMDDDALQAKGVSAVGARRKLLKVFELVRSDLDSKGVKY
ncbi:hypothetical protein HKX48_003540 [Thoreauomyces humboldtii]|nr:hypothetical protein HKX48_003540 [Thoreauomyces humboldtii]